MARAVSAQERKISRLEAKNAEQDLKIDQLSETIRHQQDVLQAWQASQKRILTTSLADLEERIARQEAKNAELDSFMNGIKQDCNLTSEKTPTGGKSYNGYIRPRLDVKHISQRMSCFDHIFYGGST